MTLSEFSNSFDLYFNNITSNQAPGLNEWEKSVFLTKAEKEIVKNYFSAGSAGNMLKQGFDDSAKRQADFSVLMNTSICTLISPPNSDLSVVYKFTFGDNERTTKDVAFAKTTPPYDEVESIPAKTYICKFENSELHTYINDPVEGYVVSITGEEVPKTDCVMEVFNPINGRIDSRSGIWTMPNDVFIVINEAIYTTDGRILQLIPLRYDEYTRLMSKPFKYPVKNQAWRLMNTGTVVGGMTSTKSVEIITNKWDSATTYTIRYVRTPLPIILAPFDGLSIDGYYGSKADGTLVTDPSVEVTKGIECELDPILHEEILQRAVELAKVAWTANGQDNAQMVIQAGQRSE